MSRPPKPRAPPAVPMAPVQPPISSPLHPEGEDENPREIRGRRSFASSWQGRKGMQSKWMWAIGRKASHGWKGPERTEGKWAAAAAASRRAFLWDKRLPLAPPGDQGALGQLATASPGVERAAGELHQNLNKWMMNEFNWDSAFFFAALSGEEGDARFKVQKRHLLPPPPRNTHGNCSPKLSFSAVSARRLELLCVQNDISMSVRLGLPPPAPTASARPPPPVGRLSKQLKVQVGFAAGGRGATRSTGSPP